MTGRTLLVTKNADGGWSVATQGTNTTQVFDSKASAVAAARQIVRRDGGVLQVANTKGHTSASFTLGRLAMAKLNAVEGVILGAAGENAFQDFDRRGLSPAQRRAKLRKELDQLSAGATGPATSRNLRAKPVKG